MFNLPFLKKSPNVTTNKFLVAVINSESIDCMAIYADTDSKKILATAKEALAPNAVRNGTLIDLDNILGTLEKALGKISEETHDNLSNVIIGVTGDICIEKVVTARIHRPQNSHLNKKEIASIYQKLNSSVYEEVQKQYFETKGDADADLAPTTTATIYTRVNNADVTSLEDIDAQKIEIAYYGAFCPTYHLEALQKISKKANLKISAIASEFYALTKALKKTGLESTDYTIIEVGSDYTSIGIVFGEGVIANKTIQIGTKHFVEEISQIMGLAIVQAEKMLASYINNQLSQSESAIVQGCLESVLKIWLEGLELAFLEFNGVKTYAPTIYITGLGAEIVDVYEIMGKEPWTKSIPFMSPPVLRKLEVKDFTNIKDATGTVSQSRWVLPIALAEIFDEITL